MNGWVEQHGAGWTFVIRMKDKTGKTVKQRHSGFSTDVEARKALKKAIALLKHEDGNIPSGITVSSYADVYLADKKPEVKIKTYLQYETLLKNHIVPKIGDMKIVDVKALQLKKMLNDLKEEGRISKNTIHHVFTVTRALFNHAVEHEYIELQNNPVSKHRLKSPGKEKKQLSFWEEHEIELALEYFKDTPIYYHVFMAVNMGMRDGEICALKTSDINFRRGYLNVHQTLQVVKREVIIQEPKTEESWRTIPLPDHVSDFLKAQIDRIETNQAELSDKYNYEWDGYLSVFDDGSIKTDLYVSKTFYKLMRRYHEEMKYIYPKPSERAENTFKIIRFHDLRHTCASWLAYNGVDIKVIQSILGHSNSSTTNDTYRHLYTDEKLNALNKLVPIRHTRKIAK